MKRRSSQFVLENDPALVPPLVAQFREDLIEMGLCDLTGATRAGVALEEALLNAVYHGNLEVSSDLRQNGDEEFHKLARERRMQEPFASRRVRVIARLTTAAAKFVIVDQGPGFDVSKLPDPTHPDYLERPSGRGVLLMRTFMDEVRYNGTGNRVTLIKRRDRVEVSRA
jgi:anti-sigma regulatory factor (Ser/Thr protein kinase)